MQNISQLKNCTACGACVNACPTNSVVLVPDDHGFLYPQIDKNECISCKRCVNACPTITPPSASVNNSPVFAAFSNNTTERKTSSSGGVFMSIAKQVIQQGGVVFGAQFDEDYNVEHAYAINLDELERFRRSKYVQSKIGKTYLKVREFLREGKVVLFSGTPCQIAGLKRFLKKPYTNLLTIDFICHGVPSSKVWQKFLLERKLSLMEKYDVHDLSVIKIQEINFRDKINSWRQFNLSLTFNIEGVGEVRLSEPIWENDYMLSFLNDYANRPSCFECKFRSGKGGSDLTMADFWGVENCIGTKDYAGEQGTSLLILHNDRLRNLLKNINMQEVVLEDAVRGNIAYYQDWQKPMAHDYFFRMLRKNSVGQALTIAQEAERKLEKYREKAKTRVKYKIKYKFLKYLYS